MNRQRLTASHNPPRRHTAKALTLWTLLIAGSWAIVIAIGWAGWQSLKVLLP